jgi:membrane protein implicated in regulation of membrane protease activity
MPGQRLMPESADLGKLLIALGLVLTLVGGLLLLAGRNPGLGHFFNWMGKLPGDISISRENFSFFFPLATSIVLSVVLSLVFYLLSWIFRR